MELEPSAFGVFLLHGNAPISKVQIQGQGPLHLAMTGLALE